MPDEQVRGSAVSRLSTAELLAIFDPDPVRAEERYRELYRNLLRYFEWNHRPDAEDLAQEALRRGFGKLQDGQRITAQDPGGYFFGIARNLLRESWRSRTLEPLVDDQPKSPFLFHKLDSAEQKILLAQCLRHLPAEEFEMLLAYLAGEGESWSKRTGVPSVVLRKRVQRVRERLEKLIDKRLAATRRQKGPSQKV